MQCCYNSREFHPEEKRNETYRFLRWCSAQSTSTTALADIAKPKKPSKSKAAIDTYLHISLKSDAKEARLIIPKSTWLNFARSSIKWAGRTTPPRLVPRQERPTGFRRSWADCFLASRSYLAASGSHGPENFRSERTRRIVVLIIFTAIGSAATFVYGNAGPPPEARSITGKMFTQAVHIIRIRLRPDQARNIRRSGPAARADRSRSKGTQLGRMSPRCRKFVRQRFEMTSAHIFTRALYLVVRDRQRSSIGSFPLAASIATIFLFAGVHNFMEFRYFAARMPVRWGRSRLYYSIGIGGVLVLAAALSHALFFKWQLALER